jgi:hypothetical protein
MGSDDKVQDAFLAHREQNIGCGLGHELEGGYRGQAACKQTRLNRNIS